jgi:hypothetical protein
MTLKPNYKRQRFERTRIKRTKSDAKETAKATQVAARRACRIMQGDETDTPEAEPNFGNRQFSIRTPSDCAE